MRLLLVTLLFILTKSYDCNSEILKLYLDPKTLSTALGQTLKVSCSYVGNQGNYSARDIRFTLNLRKEQLVIDRKFSRSLNASTALLEYPEIKAKFDRALVECQTDDRKVVSNYERVDVGRPPKKPVIFDYRMLNWNSFVFNWTVDSTNKFKTSYKAWYKLHEDSHSMNRRYKLCVTCALNERTNTSCNKCTITTLKRSSGMITLKVNASNQFGEVSAEKTIRNLLDINQPDPVRIKRCLISKTANQHGRFDVKLHLEPPRSNHSMMYSSVATCDDNRADSTDECEDRINETDETRFREHCGNKDSQTLSLPAYSDCRISVRCRSLSRRKIPIGHWSMEAFCNVQTPQTVPSAPVRTCASCFHIQTTTNHSRYVTVFFHPLSKNEARGRVTSYIVSYSIYEPAVLHQPVELSVKPNAKHAILHLDAASAYSVTIDAATEAGRNTSLEPIVMKIPQNECKFPVNVTAMSINERTIRVTWAPSHNSKKYTVFWCHSVDFHDKCKNGIYWKELHGTIRTYDVPIQYRNEFNTFGVTMIDEHEISCSISWANCIYNISSRALPPSVKTSVITSNTIMLLISRPVCDHLNSGFVYGYNISYRCLDHCGAEAGIIRTEIIENEDLIGSTYTMSNLTSNAVYQFNVSSLTVAGISPLTTSVNASTLSTSSGFTAAYYVVSAFSVVGVILMAIGIVGIVKYFKKRSWRSQIKIVIPDRPVLEQLPFNDRPPKDYDTSNVYDTSKVNTLKVYDTSKDYDCSKFEIKPTPHTIDERPVPRRSSLRILPVIDESVAQEELELNENSANSDDQSKFQVYHMVGYKVDPSQKSAVPSSDVFEYTPVRQVNEPNCMLRSPSCPNIKESNYQSYHLQTKSVSSEIYQQTSYATMGFNIQACHGEPFNISARESSLSNLSELSSVLSVEQSR